jgi:hypothetical protein
MNRPEPFSQSIHKHEWLQWSFQGALPIQAHPLNQLLIVSTPGCFRFAAGMMQMLYQPIPCFGFAAACAVPNPLVLCV